MRNNILGPAQIKDQEDYEYFVNSDQTTRFFMREAQFSFDKPELFEHQVSVKCDVIVATIMNWIDHKYGLKNKHVGQWFVVPLDEMPDC